MPRSRYLVDTNVLLQLTNRRREQYQICQDAISCLCSQGCLLYYTLQNAAEFWNVSTRPVDRNGHGLTVHEATQGLDVIERSMTLLPDNAQVYGAWRELITTHDVRGVQVHDAKLAAAMLTHEVPNILTFNGVDFARYPRIEAVHPSLVLPDKPAAAELPRRRHLAVALRPFAVKPPYGLTNT